MGATLVPGTGGILVHFTMGLKACVMYLLMLGLPLLELNSSASRLLKQPTPANLSPLLSSRFSGALHFSISCRSR
jgi:hypothetical protein